MGSTSSGQSSLQSDRSSVAGDQAFGLSGREDDLSGLGVDHKHYAPERFAQLLFPVDAALEP